MYPPATKTVNKYLRLNDCCVFVLVCEDISSLFQDACWVELGVWDELPGGVLKTAFQVTETWCFKPPPLFSANCLQEIQTAYFTPVTDTDESVLLSWLFMLYHASDWLQVDDNDETEG